MMLGTTTVPKHEPVGDLWSASARLALAGVAAHESRASATYYRKWLQQYFHSYQDSLRAVSAASGPGAVMVLVVQDSYYKDLRIDLASITLENAAQQGWREAQRYDFVAPTTMASINTRSRVYRSSFTATESVIVFERRRDS